MPGQRHLTADQISVVIPSYNHGKYIESAVMSVINQSVSGIEIVIVDDGSTDNSVAICERLAERYSQIKLIAQPNHGAHNALNHAVNIASGEFIAVLNSDDLFETQKIESALSILNERPEIEFIVGARILFIDEKSRQQASGGSIDWHRRAAEFFIQSGLLGLSLLNENFVVTTSNMIFSKQFWRTTGGFQPLRYCHDLEFLLAACRDVPVYVCNDKPQISYRVHPQNTIKEQVSKVRVEIAAVIAQAVVDARMSLIGDDTEISLSHWRKFLRNKNLSDLVIFMVMKYIDSTNKLAYYTDVMSEQNKMRYSMLLD